MSVRKAAALVNARVLTDDGLEEGCAVLIEGGRIAALVAADDPRCAKAERRDLGGQLLLPGFIDLQVNGGGGALFNDAPTVDVIREIGRAHRRFGTTAFLPTLISADLDVVAQAIAAVQTALALNTPGLL
jgi:N-acetylglucosamine-6-phosphate deacetylase